MDRLVETWTMAHSPGEVTEILQNAGVPAGAVQTPEDLFNDPQFKHRGRFQYIDHPEIGPHAYGSPGFRLSKTPGGPRRPSPCMGEHNEYVCTELLGMPDSEFIQLTLEGVFD